MEMVGIQMVWPLQKTIGQFLIKRNMLLPYSVGITLLGVYTETCTWVFMEALLLTLVGSNRDARKRVSG